MGSCPSLPVRKFRSAKTRSGALPREHRALSVSQKPFNACLFGRLPLELRHAIYVYALGGDPVRLTRTAASKDLGYHDSQWFPPYSDHDTTAGDSCPHRLSLLKTCRQIYIEATPVFYSSNTFAIYGANNLAVLYDFSQTVAKGRLDLMTSLHISCEIDKYVREGIVGHDPTMHPGAVFLHRWRQTWRIVATQMPGLKDLKVRLTKYFPPLPLTLDEDWVKPMLNVRGLRRFEIDLAQQLGSDESTAHYNEKLEWFQDKLRASMCAPR